MLTTVQKRIIGAGVGVVALLGCYLPWTHTIDRGEARSERPAGYHFIFDPPQPRGNHAGSGVWVDVPRAVIPMAVVGVVTAALTLLAGSPRRPLESGPPGGASADAPVSASPGPNGGAGTVAGPNPTAFSRTARVCCAVGGVAFLLGHGGHLVGPRADPAAFAAMAAVWAVAFGGMALVAIGLRTRTGVTAVASLFVVVAVSYLVVPILVVSTAPPVDTLFPQVGNTVVPQQGSMTPDEARQLVRTAFPDDGLSTGRETLGEYIARRASVGENPEQTRAMGKALLADVSAKFGVPADHPGVVQKLGLEVRRKAVRSEEEGTVNRRLRQIIKIGSEPAALALDRAERQARERYDAGNSTDSDLDIIALMERRRQIEAAVTPAERSRTAYP
jgi:hypothetical protein